MLSLLMLLLVMVLDAEAQLVPRGLTAQPSTNPSQEAAAPPRDTAATADPAIPLLQLADRAEQLDRLLKEISNDLIPSPEIQEVQQKTEARAEELHERILQLDELISGTPTSMELDDEQRYWRARSVEYGAQRRVVTARAAKLEEQVQLLDEQRAAWQTTWDEVKGAKGIEVLLARIRQEVDAIQATHLAVQQALNQVLTLQNQVSRYDQQISEMLTRIREATDRQRSRLLEQDSRPLWQIQMSPKLEQRTASGIQQLFERSYKRIGEFSRVHKIAVFCLLAFFSLTLLGLIKLRRYVEQHMPNVGPDTMIVLASPASLAVLIVLVISARSLELAPIAVSFVVYLLYVIPVLQLLRPLVDTKLHIHMYLVSLFYISAVSYLLIGVSLQVRRELFAFITFAALAAFGYFMRPRSLTTVSIPAPSLRALKIGVRSCLVLLAGSLIANIVGFFSLAQVLGLTALLGAFAGAALFCIVRILTLFVGLVLQSGLARLIPKTPTIVLERWTFRVFTLCASLIWLALVLRLLTAYEGVVTAAARALRYPIGYGKVAFTLAGAFSVLVIVVVGYAFARSITFLLRTFVLPKLPLQRGVPLAVSTITYYFLLILVAFAALANAGVELNKFTVLTGAIGVGLGFGLQNIVNNFVSGLILLFERPIHVGDVVDVGGLVGTVKRIGARSSTVLTFQGAEVIVPNSTLLSNQVINWTLSSEWRRVDIPVGVAYGTDPDRVLQILVDVAKSHSGVLLARPPTAFFMGFGDSALKFELRFWSAEQDSWFQLQSDVTIAIAKALEKAGIEIPFPQRDLHVRSVDASVVERLPDRAPRAISSAYRTSTGGRQ